MPAETHTRSREQLACPFTLRECHEAADAASGVVARFKGIAAIFDQQFDAWVPSMGDVVPTVVHRGAFAKTIAERSASKVKILCQHRTDLPPIGAAVSLSEGGDGLDVEGVVVGTTLGGDIAKLMRAGVLDELSIGATPIKYDFEEVDGRRVRHVREYMLHEVSVVDEGANPGSRITEVMRRAYEPQMWADLLARIENDDEARVRLAVAPFLELHAGRVLSAKNASLIKSAIEALTSLLDAAEPQAAPALTAAELERYHEARLRLIEAHLYGGKQ